MTIIAPSLLSADFLNLKTEVERFKDLKDLWLHLDVMDGHFVPNLTFGTTVLAGLKSITNHKLDAHLMVTNPQDYLVSFAAMGVHNFTFHWEAVTHHDRLIAEAKKHFSSVGVSLNPSTDIKLIPEYILKKINLILIMTVNPGFGGQHFIEGCVDKIHYLNQFKQKHNLNFEIQIDGGVTDENAPMLIKAGATNLVAGSFIFKEQNKNYASRVEALRQK